MKKFTFPKNNKDQIIIPSTLKRGTVYIDSDGDLCIAISENTYLRLLHSSGSFNPHIFDRSEGRCSDTSVDQIILNPDQDLGEKFKITIKKIKEYEPK